MITRSGKKRKKMMVTMTIDDNDEDEEDRGRWDLSLQRKSPPLLRMPGS